MIRCSDCGGTFGRKTWHSGTKYERGKTPCATPHVTDTDIEQAFVQALAERINTNTGARQALAILEATTLDTSELETQHDRAAKQVEEITVLLNQLVLTAAKTAINPDDYDTRYAELETRYNKALAKQEALDQAITDRQTRLAQARTILDFLDTNPPLEYSDEAWFLLVDHADVSADGTVTIYFKDQVSL